MFGFTYEDSDCEKYAIEKYLGTNTQLNGIMILSGGETMFDIAPLFKDGSLTAVDFNENQLEITKEKISKMHDKIMYQQNLDSLFTPFDELFIKIKNGESFDDVFSNANLTKKFGPDAVSNTIESFSEHFKNVYQLKQADNDKFYSWIFERNMESHLAEKDIELIFQVNLVHSNMLELLKPNTYDFVQVSNLGDWMNSNQFVQFCTQIKESLRPNGICVVRRLLSNNFLQEQFEGCEVIEDKTRFYKETIVWQRLVQ